PLLCLSVLFYSSYGAHSALLSVPTRRSSDLHIVQPLGLREDQLISFRSEEINETECERVTNLIARKGGLDLCVLGLGKNGHHVRSEEHTSELQSRFELVCRLLLEKKKLCWEK